MGVNLYKVSKMGWAVESTDDKEVIPFPTIEKAADHLERVGVHSDEIDQALVEMLANGDSRACFNDEGTFINSDKQKFGVA